MRHLSDAERLEWAEREEPLEGHLVECQACREEVARLRAMLVEVRACEVPEQTELFWQCFPGRVSAAIDAEDSAQTTRWLPFRRRLVLAASSAMALVFVAAAAWFFLLARPVSAPRIVEQAPGYPVSGEEATLEPDETGSPDLQAAWALLQELSDTVASEPAESQPAEPEELMAGASEIVVADLDGEEREALGRLLESELNLSQGGER
jgi:hypothetical protein